MAKTYEHYDNGLVSNFVRLLKDAELLRNHQRYASAYALAVIGLEEIAKIVLARWEDAPYKLVNLERRRTQHLTKQAAIACLLVAEHIAPSYQAIVENDKTQMRKWISEPGYEADDIMLWKVHNEEMQHAKHLALYHDSIEGRGNEGREFTHQDVDALFVYARRAVLLTGDPIALRIAYCLFQVSKDELSKT